MTKGTFYSIFLLYLLNYTVFSLNITELNINKTNDIDIELTGLSQNDLLKTYRLYLNKNISQEYIIINVKPYNNYENYSDPDIFISKSNAYVSNVEQADYFSANKGEDMIAINRNDLNDTERLFIAIRCSDGFCMYNLSVYTEDYVQLKPDTEYKINLYNRTNKIFHYQHDSNLSNKFEIYAMTGNLEDVTMKVSFVFGKNTSNPIVTKVAWINHYSTIVDTTDMFDCPKCHYKVEIMAHKESFMYIGVRIPNKVKTLEIGTYYRGTLQDEDKECFSLENLKLNSSYIMQTTSLYNTAIVSFGPTTDTNTDANSLFSYLIEQEFVNKININDNFKYVCISIFKKPFSEYNHMYGTDTPFTFIIYNLDDLESRQKYNFLVNGISSQGYLPENGVTSYKHWRYEASSSSINLNLKVIKGNPVLYGYVCMNLDSCYFNQTKTEFFAKNNNFFSTSRVNDEYNVNIPNERNSCHNQMTNGEWKNQMCSAVAVVYCQPCISISCSIDRNNSETKDSAGECIYTVTMHTSEEFYFLKPREKVSKFIVKEAKDYYKFSIENPSTIKVNVILHSHTGDADLYISRTNKVCGENGDNNCKSK